MDIWIDNRYFFVQQNYTIFQFCSKIGINLPNFCYHERLSIAEIVEYVFVKQTQP